MDTSDLLTKSYQDKCQFRLLLYSITSALPINIPQISGNFLAHFISNCRCLWCTGFGKSWIPRLCDPASWPPPGRGDEFTQPCNWTFSEPCNVISPNTYGWQSRKVTISHVSSYWPMSNKQSPSKKVVLGCVNSPPRPERQPGLGNTQPRTSHFKELCVNEWVWLLHVFRILNFPAQWKFQQVLKC